jgi:hypothetical protein
VTNFLRKIAGGDLVKDWMESTKAGGHAGCIGIRRCCVHLGVLGNNSLLSFTVQHAFRGQFIVACPPSLLTIPLTDVEPGSIDFAIAWLFVGILNSILYRAIGIVVGEICRNTAEVGKPARRGKSAIHN